MSAAAAAAYFSTTPTPIANFVPPLNASPSSPHLKPRYDLLFEDASRLRQSRRTSRAGIKALSIFMNEKKKTFAKSCQASNRIRESECRGDDSISQLTLEILLLRDYIAGRKEDMKELKELARKRALWEVYYILKADHKLQAEVLAGVWAASKERWNALDVLAKCFGL